MGTENFTPADQKIAVWPNPTHWELTLDDGDGIADGYHYTLYDVTGAKISEGQGVEGQPLDFGAISSGNYLLKSEDTEGHTATNKIIKN